MMIDDGMWRVRYKNSTDTNKKLETKHINVTLVFILSNYIMSVFGTVEMSIHVE